MPDAVACGSSTVVATGTVAGLFVAGAGLAVFLVLLDSDDTDFPEPAFGTGFGFSTLPDLESLTFAGTLLESFLDVAEVGVGLFGIALSFRGVLLF